MDNTSKAMAQVSIGNIITEELETALKKHDWYYHNSDSMRVFDAGERDAKKIRKMVIELGDEGKRLYNQYAPSEMQMK